MAVKISSASQAASQEEAGTEASARRPPPPRPRGWRLISRRAGQVLIAVGLIILLFVAYQLWGTGFWNRREQAKLRSDFREVVAPAIVPAAAGEIPPPPDAVLLPASGEALARLVIPRIGVDVIVVEGVEAADLRKGPGHLPGTSLPGEDGNVVLSGHRTTYGAPFHNLDRLDEGDEIIVESRHGRFVYEIRWLRIVSPWQYEVAESTLGLQELTLTTCHPKFSAAERLIVRAEQVAGPLPLEPPDATA